MTTVALQSTVLVQILAMTSAFSVGAVLLKTYAESDRLIVFAMALGAYGIGSAFMAELMRSQMSFGTILLLSCVVQLLLAQAIGSTFYQEPFRPVPVVLGLASVVMLMADGQ